MARQLVHIEPDPSLAEEVRRAFGPAGFSVLNLTTGESAVERCKGARPDLILLAAELPDMSGFSVCNRLKRALGPVPLILYTGEAAASAIDAHRATRTRADDYLTKPFDIADLVGRAAQLLEVGGDRSAPPPPGPPVLRRQEAPAEPRREGAAPPPVPRAAPPVRPPAPAPVPVERTRADAAERPEIVDPFADAPRDPAPPKGSPEEKLEFFRERLRARDTFLGRVKEAFAAARSEAEWLARESDTLRSDLANESAGRSAFEERTRELEAIAAQAQARSADLEKQLSEAESTRQSLSDVLSETMQKHEAAEQQWSLRLASAEEERARSEAQRKEELQRAEEDAARLDGEWQGERSELAARIHQTESEREDLAAALKRLQAQLEHETSTHSEWRAVAEHDLASVRAELDTARAHSETQAAELAEARARIESLEADAERRNEAIAALHEENKAAKAEAGAYAEKAVATEQAFLAQGAELEATRRRSTELATALDAGRASAEGVRGEVARLQEELSHQTRQLTQANAERSHLGQELLAERQSREEAQTAAEKLLAEVARLRDLETQASEGLRLRRELALAQEVLQQRTQQLESASRSAHDASAERERVREKLELEIARLSNDLARRDSEVSAHRRRSTDLEHERTEREEAARRAAGELENQRRARSAEAVEFEKRHLAETQRLKAALVDLERRLEASARAEAQLRKRAADLERQRAAPGAPSPQEIAQLRERVQALEEEAQDLRSENDFLNTEVARYHQKNKDLQSRIAAMEES